MKTTMHRMVSHVSSPQKSVVAMLFAVLLHGCAMMESDPAEVSASEETTQTAEAKTDENKTPEQQAAEEQVKQLEQQLESLKVEWAQQKPALERLVSNEADLEFLVQALADMSQLAEEPSRDQYLGQDELTPEKRLESMQALQSLVTTQEELNTLLVELSTVVSEVASNSQNMTNQSASNPNEQLQQNPTTPSTEATSMTSSASMEPVPQFSGDGQTSAGTQTSSVSYGQSTADCNCSDPAENSDPAKARDPSWYAMTTPYAEATPAGSAGQASQLDSAAANGQPIPGLAVKSFKRRTLPSELAEAGADMRHYAMAPQFHMSRKSLSDYVSQLAFKLAGNQQLAGNKIGVASFVFFDEQLEQTSSVGNQLAEELSTVLPNYGALVVEYKLTREITVSPTGDLSLSRNTKKLRDSQGMDYVLTGTMVPTRRGLQINSRVVSTRNNIVIASATTLIPAMVLQQL